MLMLPKTLQVSFCLALGSAQVASAQISTAPSDLFQFDSYSPSTEAASASASFNPGDFPRHKVTVTLAFATACFEGGLRAGQPPSRVTDLRPPLTSVKPPDHYNDSWTLYCRSNEVFDPQVTTSLFADLPRFEQPDRWRICKEGILSYNSPSRRLRIVLCCGPQFIPSSYGFDHERCLGLVFRFDLGKRKQARP